MLVCVRYWQDSGVENISSEFEHSGLVVAVLLQVSGWQATWAFWRIFLPSALGRM